MDKYLLDTNACISLLKNRFGIREHIIKVGVDNCCVSEITLAELYYGAAKSGRQKHYEDVNFIATHFTVLPIRPVMEVFGKVRYALELKGTRIDDFDLLIGCTALYNDFVVVTHNLKLLGRIPNIKYEDWQEE